MHEKPQKRESVYCIHETKKAFHLSEVKCTALKCWEQGSVGSHIGREVMFAHASENQNRL